MHNVLLMINAGEAGSQAVYPRASNVWRMPPEGNEDASGSACDNCSPLNDSTTESAPACSINASCFSAVPSVSG